MNDGPSMRGKTCVVTGASSGIGRALAGGLMQLGAEVVMLCRNPALGEEARQEIESAGGGGSVELVIGDLSTMAGVRGSAAEIRRRHPRIHVLINNAGVAPNRRSITSDGFELTFAVNHLAPFLLTHLLLDSLHRAERARIVNVASSVHAIGKVNFDDLECKRLFGARAYPQSKLCNVMFTYALAERLAGSGITVNCFDPGMTRTRIGAENDGLHALLYQLLNPFAQTPEEGAETGILLATAPELEGVTGKYFARSKERRSSARSYDVAVRERLWALSATLTGIEAT